MQSVLSALVAALNSLFHSRILALIWWPMLAAMVLWVGAALFFWGSWVTGLTGMVHATPVEQWMAQGMFATAMHYLISVILVLLLLPAIYVTALLLTAVFAMPTMVNHVAQQYYPELERKQGGSNTGSIVNALIAILVYGVGWVLSLPLWLFSPLALVFPIILMAYLNQRLFRYDALAEHASREEYRQLIERTSFKLYLLGALAGLLQFVPLLNLFSPVYTALAFIHLCLAELKKIRQPA
ncbi:MAG: EI24 domain-containing protein [Sideroxydans sp.]|jgi:hypothetical protein